MGRLAQLVEHLVYTEEVGGSIPSSPTIILFTNSCGIYLTILYYRCTIWGCSSVGLERLPVTQEVEGSSPFTPATLN